MLEPVHKDWVDILSALLTPTIAVLGAYIAWQQVHVNRASLKHELFDRRYQVFEATRDYLGGIQGRGRVVFEEEFKWLQAIRGSRFLFDESISAYFEEIFKLGATLQGLDDDLKGITVGEERSRNVRRQREIKDELMGRLNGLEDRFAPYLQLRD